MSDHDRERQARTRLREATRYVIARAAIALAFIMVLGIVVLTMCRSAL